MTAAESRPRRPMRGRAAGWLLASLCVLALGSAGYGDYVDQLIKKLRDKHADVRAGAAATLGNYGARAVEPLVGALKDPEMSVRKNVVEALGKMKDPRAVDALIAELADPVPGMRTTVVYTLGEMRDPRAVDALIAALKDADAEVRIQVPFALWKIHDPRAVEPVIGALSDTDPRVRRAAAQTLGEFQDTRAVTPLAAALEDKASYVRTEAAAALRNIGDPAIPALVVELQKAGAQVRLTVQDTLARMGSAAVGPLLGVKEPDAALRENVAVTLGEIGAPAVAPLATALKDGDPGVRQTAAMGLGNTKNSSAVDPLGGALKDPNAEVRASAAAALAKLGTLGANALTAALKNPESEANVREAAARGLGASGEAGALQPLLGALSDADPRVRVSAAEALGQLKNARARDALIAESKDPDARVREAAAKALEEIPDRLASQLPFAVEGLRSENGGTISTDNEGYITHSTLMSLKALHLGKLQIPLETTSVSSDMMITTKDFGKIQMKFNWGMGVMMILVTPEQEQRLKAWCGQNQCQ